MGWPTSLARRRVRRLNDTNDSRRMAGISGSQASGGRRSSTSDTRRTHVAQHRARHHGLVSAVAPDRRRARSESCAGTAAGRVRRPAGRDAGLCERAQLEHVAEVLDDGRDRHQPHHRAGRRHAPPRSRPPPAPRRRRRARSRSRAHPRSRGRRGHRPRSCASPTRAAPAAQRSGCTACGSSARTTAIATTSPADHVIRGACSRWRERAREARHHHPRIVRIDPGDSRRLGGGQPLHAEHGNAPPAPIPSGPCGGARRSGA